MQVRTDLCSRCSGGTQDVGILEFLAKCSTGSEVASRLHMSGNLARQPGGAELCDGHLE